MPQTGLLVIGYSFGCYQLWKLSVPVLEWVWFIQYMYSESSERLDALNCWKCNCTNIPKILWHYYFENVNTLKFLFMFLQVQQ